MASSATSGKNLLVTAVVAAVVVVVMAKTGILQKL
jgi:hypothetical protein